MPKAKALRSNKHVKARIWEFARDDLPALKANVHAAGMPGASTDDIASALIWTARRMPGFMVRAMIETYIREESDAFLAAQEAEAPDAD